MKIIIILSLGIALGGCAASKPDIAQLKLKLAVADQAVYPAMMPDEWSYYSRNDSECEATK
jgi:hypothetical protein